MRKHEYMMYEIERQQLTDNYDEEQYSTKNAALNNDLTSQESENFLYWEVYTLLVKKAKSRIRHHNNVKAKIRTKKAATYLSSKLNKLSSNATNEEDSRLNARTIAAQKRATRLK